MKPLYSDEEMAISEQIRKRQAKDDSIALKQFLILIGCLSITGVVLYFIFR